MKGLTIITVCGGWMGGRSRSGGGGVPIMPREELPVEESTHGDGTAEMVKRQLGEHQQREKRHSRNTQTKLTEERRM